MISIGLWHEQWCILFECIEIGWLWIETIDIFCSVYSYFYFQKIISEIQRRTFRDFRYFSVQKFELTNQKISTVLKRMHMSQPKW